MLIIDILVLSARLLQDLIFEYAYLRKHIHILCTYQFISYILCWSFEVIIIVRDCDNDEYIDTDSICCDAVRNKIFSFRALTLYICYFC